MQKQEIVSKLKEIGYSDELALETYENAFRGLPWQKHEDMMASYSNNSTKSKQDTAQEAVITMTETNCTPDNFTCKFDIALWNDGNPRSLTITPCNFNGNVMHIQDGVNVMSALNAAIDYFYFADFSSYKHMSLGLHLKYSPEEIALLQVVENAGIITNRYPDDASLLIPKSNFHPVGIVNFSFGRFVTTRIGYDKNWATKPHSKEQRIIRKHGFADLLLEGRQLVIQFGKVRDWAKIVVETLTIKDKEAAWHQYQDRKNNAARTEVATTTGDRLMARLDGDFDEARKTEIKVTVGGNLIDTTLGELPQDQLIYVINKNEGTEAVTTYGDSQRDIKKFIGWIAKGMRFVIEN